MSRRGGLPQREQFCLLSLSLKGRDCEAPVGMAAARRAAVLKGVLLYAGNVVLNFTRPGPRNRLGEVTHGILSPEKGFLHPSKGEKFGEYPNPVPNRAGGHRQ